MARVAVFRDTLALTAVKLPAALAGTNLRAHVRDVASAGCQRASASVSPVMQGLTVASQSNARVVVGNTVAAGWGSANVTRGGRDPTVSNSFSARMTATRMDIVRTASASVSRASAASSVSISRTIRPVRTIALASVCVNEVDATAFQVKLGPTVPTSPTRYSDSFCHHTSVTFPQARCRRFPTSAQLCEGRGTCRYSKCFCDPAYAGEFCHLEEVCPHGCVKGQGSCFNGKCVCNPGFKGVDCSEDVTCPGSPLPCSGNGVCMQGSCMCLPHYEGPACSKIKTNMSLATCPGNCTDGGVCHMGRCFCVEGRQGPDCSMKTQDACPRSCSDRGLCFFGNCYCKPGFAGKACEKEVKCEAQCMENGVCR